MAEGMMNMTDTHDYFFIDEPSWVDNQVRVRVAVPAWKTILWTKHYGKTHEDITDVWLEAVQAAVNEPTDSARIFGIIDYELVGIVTDTPQFEGATALVLDITCEVEE
jgi:hypothetical protein